MVMTAADMSVSKNSDTYLYALRHIICERRALSVKEGGRRRGGEFFMTRP